MLDQFVALTCYNIIIRSKTAMLAQLLIELPHEEGINHIQEYLTAKEGQRVEFKQRLSKPEKIAKTLAAFANTAGGILLVGVSDQIKVTGVDPEQEKHILEIALGFHIQPHIQAHVTEVLVTSDQYPYEEMSVLKVEVQESEEKPHKAKDSSGNWQVHLRERDQTLAAGPTGERVMRTSPAKRRKLTKNEQRLLQYLQDHSKITLKGFTDLVNISDRRARRELYEALQKGLIRILEHEKEDYYVL